MKAKLLTIAKACGLIVIGLIIYQVARSLTFAPLGSLFASLLLVLAMVVMLTEPTQELIRSLFRDRR